MSSNHDEHEDDDGKIGHKGPMIATAVLAVLAIAIFAFFAHGNSSTDSQPIAAQPVQEQASVAPTGGRPLPQGCPEVTLSGMHCYVPSETYLYIGENEAGLHLCVTPEFDSGAYADIGILTSDSATPVDYVPGKRVNNITGLHLALKRPGIVSANLSKEPCRKDPAPEEATPATPKEPPGQDTPTAEAAYDHG